MDDLIYIPLLNCFTSFSPYITSKENEELIRNKEIEELIKVGGMKKFIQFFLNLTVLED